MSAVTGASIFERFTITSRDGSKEVDIRGGVIDFQYFEDLFSPTTTAIVQVANTGNTIDGQGIYHGLPIRSGERVNFRIKTPVDATIGSESVFDYVMYVDKVTNYVSDRQFEGFVLHLVSREAITNSQVRVTRKFVNKTIDKSLQQIVGLLDPLQGVQFEKCENVYPFIGNLRKPFTLAIMLAKKAIPVGAKSGSSGFFFWQTKNGFNFKSIDGLIKNAVNLKSTAQRYTYKQTVEDGYANPAGNAVRILEFNSNKNNDLTESLEKGEYSSYRMYFNPLTFEFTQPKDAVFKPKDDVRLGHTEVMPAVADPDNIPVNYMAPRILTGVYNVGTLDVGVSTAVNYDPYNDVAQGSARYSKFFTYDYTILVPCNTNLTAGDPVYLEIPKTTTETPEYDPEQSGLYIIKEITHKFYTNKSYTSMRVVRDTFGTNGQK